MFTVLTVVILVAICIILCSWLPYLLKKRKQKQLLFQLNALSLLGTQKRLIFTCHIVLPQSIIGVDGFQKKLLIVSRIKKHSFHTEIIDLKQVSSFNVKRFFSPVRGNNTLSQTDGQHIQKIVLQIELKNKKEPVEIVFYSGKDNRYPNCAALEHQAIQWKIMLNKMMNTHESAYSSC